MKRIPLALFLFASLAVAQEAETAKADAPEKAAEEAIARIAEIDISLDDAEDPYPHMPLGPQRRNFREFLGLIQKAAHDPDLDGIILQPKQYGVGMARLLEVRDALAQLRASGKKVFLYKESLTPPDLILGSVADRISIPESGTVFLPGVAGEMWYMKGLLDKVHLRFDVIHIGAYKTAGESLVRDSMSDEMRESMDPILDEFYGAMVKAIAEGRGISEDAVKQAIDRGLLNAKDAKAADLIDRIEYYDQFKDGVKSFFPGKKLKLAGDYGKRKGMELDSSNPMAAFSMIFGALLGGQKEPKVEGPKVAVVYCTGAITSGKSQYDWQGEIASMGSETIVEAIDKAAKDDEVKAIVLRVNSPGGSGLASDMIWRAVARAKEKKPVVTSMGDVAASGGYYIAMNSDAIVAQPATITGSIGVVGMVPNPDDFFPWVGINPERLTRGKRAAALMTSKGLTQEDKDVLREYMTSFYADFVGKVAAGRGKTPAEIEPLARGRVWTGRDALERGLVDKLGGLEDAIALAREKAGLEESNVVEYPRRKGPFDVFQEMFGVKLGLDLDVLERMPELRRVLRHVSALQRMSQDRICVVAPELAGLASPFGK